MENIEQEKLQAAISHLDKRLVELFEQAYKSIDDHWIWVRAMEQRVAGWEQKSQLQVRCVKIGNSIRVGWTQIRWSGAKAGAGRTQIRVHIRRPKDGYGYTISKLRKLARDWEADAVETLELELVKIRREASFIVKAIGNLQNAQGIRCPIAEEEDPMDEQD